MKQCPACDFSFPDFHLVCDFDGTELVSIPEKPSNIAPRPSRLRRLFNSPIWLISVTGLALFSSAILFGFYDAIYQSATVVKSGAPSANTASATPPMDVSAGWTQTPQPGFKRPKRLASPAKNHVRAREIASRAKLRHLRRTSSAPTEFSETARRTNPQPVLREKQEASVAVNNPKTRSSEPQPVRVTAKDPPRVTNDKDPKVVAMLKTTWRVLKRPFKF